MKTCPRCGKQMVEKVGPMLYLTNPGQYDLTWWCGCGYAEHVGRVYAKTPEESLRDKWERINKT